MCIRDIINKKPERIAHFRRLLFPLMDYNVITGFNIYEQENTLTDAKFIINYLHSQLKEEDEHRQELECRLSKYTKNSILKKIEHEVVDRHASYKLKPGWDAEEYFDIYGRKLSDKALEDARLAGETIIGGGIQFDLQIQLDSKEDFIHTLGLLQKYTNFYKIKPSGNFVYGKGKKPLRNKQRIADAWKIPLLLVTTDETFNEPAYPSLSRVSLQREEFQLDVLIDKKQETFTQFLSLSHEESKKDEHYANRIFVNWVNKGLYSKRYVEFLREIRNYC